MAALLCAVQTLQQRARQQREQAQQEQQAPAAAAVSPPPARQPAMLSEPDLAPYTSPDAVQLNFRFAIIASGYPAAGQQAQQLLRAAQPLALPSLHIYGSSGEDRQVSSAASAELEAMFDSAGRWVVRHQSGHILPVARSYVTTYRQFLQQFRVESSN